MKSRVNRYGSGLAALLFLAPALWAQDEPVEPPEEQAARSEERVVESREDLTTEELAIIAAFEAAGPLEMSDLLPCHGGTHGPPLNAVITREDETQIEILDPCGLRFTDLSGLWSNFGRQTIVTHDQRTGDFAIRMMHISNEDDWYVIWGYQFGDYQYRGRIGLEAVAIEISAFSRFPVTTRENCPEQFERSLPSNRVYLGYSMDGRPRMISTRPRYSLESDCSITFLENVDDHFIKLEFEGDR